MGTRIREIRIWRGLTQEELARRAKTTGATVSRWENFPSRVTVPVLTNLARILDVSPAELLTGVLTKPPTPKGIVMVRDLAAKRDTAFDLAELESNTEVSAEALAVLHVRGDAMAPTLNDGDKCLVNTEEKDVFSPGLYCIQLGHTAQARRLSINPTNGCINICTDNHDHYDNYMDVAPNKVHIIGRVVWVGHKL